MAFRGGDEVADDNPFFRAAFQQRAHDVDVARAGGIDQRSLTLNVGRLDVSAFGEERLHRRRKTLNSGCHQGGTSLFVCRGDIGPMRQQHVERLGIAAERGAHQRRRSN